MKGLDRRQIAFVNQRHVTEETLDEAITSVIDAYAAIGLHHHWGTGASASADGMKWDVHPQSLMTEYHIRYGGYGGIGYYLVSDTYIALFSRFIACGAYEGHSILDFVAENRSAIQPSTVHADTHGQSAPIFGLAYLLGIELMPRIRNWQDLHLFRPSAGAAYAHIDALFSGTIDWQLIAEHLPDMLRVALSIKAGRLLPSAILRRLGTYSRKNRLYFAFRELGRAVRTAFLLRYHRLARPPAGDRGCHQQERALQQIRAVGRASAVAGWSTARRTRRAAQDDQVQPPGRQPARLSHRGRHDAGAREHGGRWLRRRDQPRGADDAQPLPDRAHQPVRRLRARPVEHARAASLHTAGATVTVASDGRRRCVRIWRESLPWPWIALVSCRPWASAKPQAWRSMCG